MTDEEERILPGFEGPIEKGETSHLPTLPNMGEGIASDKFEIESDTIPSENLLSVVLPKFIMHANSVVSEKSFLLLTYSASHDPSVFQAILKACKKPPQKFFIHFKNEEEDDIISTWSLTEVRVHAIDFGHIAIQRSEPATISVELTYNKLLIDDFEF